MTIIRFLSVAAAIAVLSFALAATSGNSAQLRPEWVSPPLPALLAGLAALAGWHCRSRHAVQPAAVTGSLSEPSVPVPPRNSVAAEPAFTAADTPDSFDLRQTIGAAVSPFQQEAKARGLSLTTHVARDVPHALAGDALGFAASLRCLTGQALTQTSRGGVHVEIEADSTGQAGQAGIRVTVSDSGEGLSPEKLRLLFRSTARWMDVDQWSRRTGGFTWAQSDRGVGTVAGFTTVMTIARSAAPEAATVRSQRMRVLIADDNAVSRKLTIRALERAGHQTEVATNGLQALHKAIHSGYDAILVDVHVAEIDGVGMTSRLREVESAEGRHTPVIGLTSRPMIGERSEWLRAGIDDFLTKPLDSRVLLEKLAHWSARS